MKLSVIIPAYKFSAYIHECLLSVLAQKTSFNFEVLVCNDCSPDNTLEVIRYLAPAYPQLKVQAEFAKAKWCEFHNSENYITELISDIPFKA